MERYRSHVSVNLILYRKTQNDETEVLLQLRQNTGYMDGLYDLGATGNIEENEPVIFAMQREAKEELGIDLKIEDLKFEQVYDSGIGEGGKQYIHFIFSTKECSNMARVNEEDKCGGLLWCNTKNLPQNIIPRIVKTIENFENGITYYQNGYSKLNQ